MAFPLFTFANYIILDLFKGDLKNGEDVFFVEMGGKTTFGQYEKGCNIEEKVFEVGLERLPDDYQVIIGFDGFYPLQKNEEVLLFGGDSTEFLKDIEGPIYDIIGSYDGNLFLQGDGSYAKPLPGKTDKLEFGEESLTITSEELQSIQ